MTTSSQIETPSRLETCPPWCLGDHAIELKWRTTNDPEAGAWHFGAEVTFEGRTGEPIVVRQSAWEDRPGSPLSFYLEIEDVEIPLNSAVDVVSTLACLVAQMEGSR
jgi:hypothetical protein